jgi:hypothetical protein
MSPVTDAPSTDRSTAEQSVIAKVRKLLAMAEGTDNPEESDAFARKAADLIARHRVSESALREVDHGQLEVAELDLGRGAYVRARFHLLAGIAEAHGCLATFMTGSRGTLAHVTGHRRDTLAVRVLFTSLLSQMTHRAGSERRATAAATQRWRRSFMFGFADEVAAMLQSARHEAIAATDDPASTLPALRAQDEVVREFAGERLGRIVTARPAAPAVRDGLQAGRRAAAESDVGRVRLRGRTAIGSGS